LLEFRPEHGVALRVQRRKLSVAEWDRIIASGALPEDDRVELINGEILEMSPIGTRHAACVARLTAAFAPLVSQGVVLWVQSPVSIADFDEPQPDLALLRPRDDAYADQRPRAEDILLLVEVADTSFDYDRGVKVPRYAASGVQEVWLVDLNGNRVVTLRDAGPDTYQRVRVAGAEDTLVPAALPELRVAVSTIL
jgi:Uma2 family endonuclease